MYENEPLASIIMPVYNCEKYISEAVESVISQNYDNWELLIIDDDSNDNSVSIITSYVEKDSRIQLYRNDTGEHGPGLARNYGMDRIRGKYTYFIDSDDWIEKELLRDTVTLAERTGADIVPFGFVIEENGIKKKKSLKPCGNYEYSDFAKIANEILRETWPECHELVRSDVLRNVRHNQYRTAEDICFQMDLLCHVKKVCGIDKEYYHYRVVQNSISRTDTWDDMLMEANIAVWDKEKKFLEHCGLNHDSQIIKNTAIERYTWCIYCLTEKRCTLSLVEKHKLINSVANRMQINKYKNEFDFSGFSGMRKYVKLLIKFNLELGMILVGTTYFRLCTR